MLPKTSGLTEKIGLATGTLLSPLFLLGSSWREARVFHPEGVCFHARVQPAKAVRPALEELSQRFTGDALVRMSSALWREEHRFLPNLLGFAIRFKAWHPLEQPTEESQDLLMVSARNIWTLGLDSLITNQRDFLVNRYFGMSPFSLDSGHSVYLRITPKPQPSRGEDRYDRLRDAVKTGDVTLLLEILDKKIASHWQALAEIHLEREVDVNETELRFWPFRNGLGIRPKGFVHYLRPVPYIASWFGRGRPGEWPSELDTSDKAAQWPGSTGVDSKPYAGAGQPALAEGADPGSRN